MTLLPVNHCFHRIRILIIGDGLVTGAIIPVGEAVVNLVDLPGFRIHNTLITQGGVALLLAHNVIAFVAVLPGGHDAVGHFAGCLAKRLGGSRRLITLGHGKALEFPGVVQAAQTLA